MPNFREINHEAVRLLSLISMIYRVCKKPLNNSGDGFKNNNEQKALYDQHVSLKCLNSRLATI